MTAVHPEGNKFDHVQLPSFLKRSIPYPQGPYTTGCIDLMVGRKIDGILMRVFYPTDEDDIRNQPTERWTSWYLGEHYCTGLAVFMATLASISCSLFKFFHFIYKKIIISILSYILIPSIWRAPISNCKKKIPVVIFSHGLAGHRAWMSSVCSNIASYGFLVAAMEHRDGTACATFTLTADRKKEWIIMKEHTAITEDDVQIRQSQIDIRVQECSKALDILHQLNDGVPTQNFLHCKFELNSLKGKLDLSKPCMAGNSLGGATALAVLGRDKRFKYGISMDPWMLPIVFKAKQLSRDIQQPILFVLMEKFQNQKNMAYIKLFNNGRNTLYTIKGGCHQHQVDSAMIFANDFVFMQKQVVSYSTRFHARVPMSINIALTLRFMFDYLGIEKEHREAMAVYIAKQDDHIIHGIHGTAKYMLGWEVCDLSEKACPSWESILVN